MVFLLFQPASALAQAGSPEAQLESRSEAVSDAPTRVNRDASSGLPGLQYFPPSSSPSDARESRSEAVSEAPARVDRDASSGLPGLQYFPPSSSPSESRDAGLGVQPGLPSDVGPGREHLSADPRVRVARLLIQLNRFPEALKILRSLPPDHPDQTDVRFLLGLAAMRGAQANGVDEETRVRLLDEAIAAFRSILIRHPELVRVRLELGLAFFLKEDDGLAADHFERVLTGDLPSPIVSKVRRFLSVMQARRRWDAYFGFSIAPDTNINAASDAQFIYINGLPFRRSGIGQASSDIGVVGWGGGEYQYPLSDRLRLRLGLNLNHREYKGKTFDQTFVGGYVGPRWLVSRDTELSLLGSVSQRWWGQSSFNYDYGARLEVEHRFFPGLLGSARASWQDRKYQQNTFLEGPLMVFSLGGSYVPFPILQVNSLVGYLRQDAQEHRWNSDGYWFRIGANVALPWGFTVGASGEFRWDYYEDGWVPFIPDNSAREDQTRILQATLLNRAVTVYGFSPQIMFSNQVRDSNAQTFDFKRNLVEMRFVRQF